MSGRRKGRITEAKRKPGSVWIRREDDDEMRKVVMDVKITSTDNRTKHFNKGAIKDESETRKRLGKRRRRWGRRTIDPRSFDPYILPSSFPSRFLFLFHSTDFFS